MHVCGALLISPRRERDVAAWAWPRRDDGAVAAVLHGCGGSFPATRRAKARPWVQNTHASGSSVAWPRRSPSGGHTSDGQPRCQGEQGSALGTCARTHARRSKAARRTASTVAPRHAGGAIRRGSIRGEQRLRLGGPAEAMRMHAGLGRTRAAVWPHKARQRWVRNGDGGLRVVARWRHSDPCT